MITVMVDTTTTFVDVMMSRTRWTQLLTLCAKGEVQLIVSEVVLRETARHWQKESRKSVAEAEGRWTKIAKSKKSFDYLGLEPKIGLPPELPEVVIDAKKFYDDAVGRLAPLGVDIRALPQVEIATVLERDLAGRKPFETSGKGFRDALVWETLLEIVDELTGDDVLYFVTNNTNDYCLDGDLHPDLKADLGAASANVYHVDSLEGLLDLPDFSPLVSALAKTDAELASYLTTASTDDPDYEDYAGSSVGDVVSSALVSGAETLLSEEVRTGNEMTSGLDFTNFDLPSQVESVYISSIAVDEDTATWQTYETFEGGTLYIQGEIEAELSFIGYVFKSDAYAMESEVHVTDWEWNEHYVEVGFSAEARLMFQVVVEPGQDFAQNCEFEGAEPLAPPVDDHPWPAEAS